MHSVFLHEHVGYCIRGQLATTNNDESAHDRSDLLMTKRIARNFELPQTIRPHRPRGSKYMAHSRIIGWRGKTTKCGKIMFADQRLGGLLHGGKVQ